MPGDGNLVVRMPVHLDEHFDAQGVGLRGQFVDERERLRDHETARARFLDRKSDGIEPDDRDAGVMEACEHVGKVPASLRVRHVDVDLIAGERGPEQQPRCRVRRHER